MTFKVGGGVWVPCEVKPGPFSDERLVKVNMEGSSWVGFVTASGLKEDIREGKTCVRTIVVDVSGNKFMSVFPGSGVNSGSFHGDVRKVK